MKKATSELKNNSRKLFGNGWVANEMQTMQTLTRQQGRLPVSVEEAIQQVKRLKEQSLSIVKKRQAITQP